MTIGRIGHQKLVRNATTVGAQRQVVKKRDMKGAKDQEEVQSHHDSITLSDQAKRGEKAGETTGSTGRKGAKETRKDEASGKKKKSGEKKEVATEEKVETPQQQPEGIETGAEKPAEAGTPQAGAEPDMPPGIEQEAGFAPGTIPMNGQMPGGPGGPGNIPPGGPGGPGNVPPGGGEMPSSSPYTDAANQQKLRQDDLQGAQTIYTQMAADRQKWMMKMWEIIQDMQTKMMEIMQGVAVRRAQTMDNIAAKWAACLGGYG